MSRLWGWRQLGGVCEIQTAAEENHQGWPTPVGGSPPVSLKVVRNTTCISMGLDEEARYKEFVCNLRELFKTGNRKEMSTPA